MNRMLVAVIAVAVGIAAAEQASAQSHRRAVSPPVPPASNATPGTDLEIIGDPDPVLRTLDNGVLIYDLRGGKMVNCQAAGVPAAGSVGAAAPLNPCR